MESLHAGGSSSQVLGVSSRQSWGGGLPSLPARIWMIGDGGVTCGNYGHFVFPEHLPAHSFCRMPARALSPSRVE